MTRTLGIVLVAAIAAASLFALRGARAQQGSLPNSQNTLAVDMDKTAPGIQQSATVPVGSTFTFTIVLTAAPDPYLVYQSNIHFNPSVVQYVSGPVENGADGNSPAPGATGLGHAVLCAPGTEDTDRVFGGCVIADFKPQTNTGNTETWTMKCIAEGATSLHFLTNDEVGPAVGTQFALGVNSAPELVNPVAEDGVVNCGAGTPVAGSTAAAQATESAQVTPVSKTPGAPPDVPTPNPTQIEEAKTPGSPAQVTVTALAGAATARAYIISAQRTAAVAGDPTFVAQAKTPGSAAAKTQTAQKDADAADAAQFPALKTATASAQQLTHKANGSGGSSHTGLIIGIIVAVAVVVLAGAGGAMVLRRRSGS